MNEAGHIGQLAWVLTVAVDKGIVSSSRKKMEYLKIAKGLLSKFIEHGGLKTSTGSVYDAFDRITGKPLLDSNGKATSAWWSNLEVIIAFSMAEKHKWFDKTQINQILNTLTRTYFENFVDHINGGEFFRIDTESGNVVDSTKGGPGKSGYHITEAYRYLTTNK
jgi:mannose/cellobiose epimerase-like protein (N-acyl-D-glucosamine 2-epimerase family)